METPGQRSHHARGRAAVRRRGRGRAGGRPREIDALSIYPVPDGDTGTNMYLTVSAAR